MEGTAWQVRRAMAAPAASTHSSCFAAALGHSCPVLCSSSAQGYLPWPRERLWAMGCALGAGAAPGLATRCFPPALPVEHHVGLWLRAGFSPFYCPTALLPLNLPGSEPRNCSHCLQAAWDGGPETPPHSLVLSRAEDLLCASVINLSSVNGYSSSQRSVLGTEVNEPVCYSAAAR